MKNFDEMVLVQITHCVSRLDELRPDLSKTDEEELLLCEIETRKEGLV
jgi:hypothetical protein